MVNNIATEYEGKDDCREGYRPFDIMGDVSGVVWKDAF
jgi:hypothetical protein